jgi:hypothetical protein
MAPQMDPCLQRIQRAVQPTNGQLAARGRPCIGGWAQPGLSGQGGPAGVGPFMLYAGHRLGRGKAESIGGE